MAAKSDIRTGHCLCGAVTITVRGLFSDLSACHCSMCRRWTGTAMWGMDADPETVSVKGPVARYASSHFSERAWCERCGSHLWMRDTGGVYELMPGLFEEARGMPLEREVYADRAFACVRLAGDHPRVSRADYEATHLHLGAEA